MKAQFLLTAACLALGITEEDVRRSPQITPQLRLIARDLRRAGQPRVTRRVLTESGHPRDVTVLDTEHRLPYGPGCDLHTDWPFYLAQSDSPDARAVLDQYDKLPKRERYQLPVEAFCVAAKVPPIHILSILAGIVVGMNAQASVVIGAINQPRVVQKLVDRALDDFEDTRMEAATLLSRATGFLPSPKGAQTNIQVNTQASANAVAASVAAPPPEQAIRRLTDRFNAVRGLPPAAPPTLAPGPVRDAMPATIIHEAELVEAAEDDDVLSS